MEERARRGAWYYAAFARRVGRWSASAPLPPAARTVASSASMMGDAAVARDLSYEDYLALERASDTRHEWVDGVAYAMAGGTPAHALLTSRVIVELARILGDGPCNAYTADLKIRPKKIRFASYADVAVVCGEVETHPDDPNAILNPTVLVEVLSDSTEDWDRGGKFVRYRKLATLRDYVLVSQHERRIEVHSRRDDGVWEMREVGEGESVRLTSFADALSVDRVYRGVTLTPSPTGERPAG